MFTSDSEISFTSNFGLCLTDQNCRSIHELKGESLNRALSFLHYFINLDSNIDLILNELNLMLKEPKKNENTINKSPIPLTIQDCKTIFDLIVYFRSMHNLEISTESLISSNDYQILLKQWVNTKEGLFCVSDRFKAMFNDQGAFYYHPSNKFVTTQNCPLISTLLG